MAEIIGDGNLASYAQNTQVGVDSGVITIGVVGPTCSGKTTASHILAQALGDRSKVLSQDNYFFGCSEDTNYDVREALDFGLTKRHLKEIKQRKVVEVPCYDFSTHSRLKKTTRFEPTDVVILEGILLFCDPELVDLLDIKVYIQSNPEQRKQRRIKRDTKERGRTVKEVLERYERDVVPSNRELVEPSRRYADTILIDNCDYSFEGMDKLITKIYKKLGMAFEKQNLVYESF